MSWVGPNHNLAITCTPVAYFKIIAHSVTAVVCKVPIFPVAVSTSVAKS